MWYIIEIGLSVVIIGVFIPVFAELDADYEIARLIVEFITRIF